MERFIAILLEHTAGNFPLWLTPEQVIILSISEKYEKYAKKVLNLLEISDIRATIDNRNEKIGRKIRDAEVGKVPYMIIIGEQEADNGTISVRKHKEGNIGSFTVDDFVQFIKKEEQKDLKKFDY
jgi:threonyl-tRNA synthetase